MAIHRPTKDAAFLAIKGVGNAKLAQFGPAFMDLIRAPRIPRVEGTN